MKQADFYKEYIACLLAPPINGVDLAITLIQEARIANDKFSEGRGWAALWDHALSFGAMDLASKAIHQCINLPTDNADNRLRRLSRMLDSVNFFCDEEALTLRKVEIRGKLESEFQTYKGEIDRDTGLDVQLALLNAKLLSSDGDEEEIITRIQACLEQEQVELKFSLGSEKTPTNKPGTVLFSGELNRQQYLASHFLAKGQYSNYAHAISTICGSLAITDDRLDYARNKAKLDAARLLLAYPDAEEFKSTKQAACLLRDSGYFVDALLAEACICYANYKANIDKENAAFRLTGHKIALQKRGYTPRFIDGLMSSCFESNEIRSLLEGEQSEKAALDILKSWPDPFADAPDEIAWENGFEFKLNRVADPLPVYISKSFVTFRQFNSYLDESGAEMPRIWDGLDKTISDTELSVALLSQIDARLFANWFGARLPITTEVNEFYPEFFRNLKLKWELNEETDSKPDSENASSAKHDTSGTLGNVNFLDRELEFAEGVTVNSSKFLRLLSGSISLTKDEKHRVIDSLPRLSQIQVEELYSIFQEEKQKFAELEKEFAQDVRKLKTSRIEELEHDRLRADLGWIERDEIPHIFCSDSNYVSLLVAEAEQEPITLANAGLKIVLPFNGINIQNGPINKVEDYNQNSLDAILTSISADPDRQELDYIKHFSNKVRNSDGSDIFLLTKLTSNPSLARNFGNLIHLFPASEYSDLFDINCEIDVRAKLEEYLRGMEKRSNLLDKSIDVMENDVNSLRQSATRILHASNEDDKTKCKMLLGALILLSTK